MKHVICKLPHWVQDPEGLKAQITRSKGLAESYEYQPLLKEIRELIPVDGDDWTHHIEVLIEPGQKTHQAQQSHAHREWTAVFYVKTGNPTVPIIVEGKEVYPVPGDVVIMEPNTEHEVAPSHSTTERLSLAMLVPDYG